MNIYILYSISIDHSESINNVNYKKEEIAGVFKEYKQAVAYMEILHNEYRSLEISNPDLFHCSKSCQIKEFNLIE